MVGKDEKPEAVFLAFFSAVASLQIFPPGSKSI